MQSYEYKSVNYFLEPGLRFRRGLGESPIFLGAHIGYHFLPLKGDFVSQDYDDLFLDTYLGRAGANWSGGRMSVSIGYRFKKQ